MYMVSDANTVEPGAKSDEEMMKFHHIFCWGNFGETDTFPIIYQRGNGNFRFPSISHRNLSISLKSPSKNYGGILVFFAGMTFSWI